MLKRSITAFLLIGVILMVLFLSNVWIFSAVISLICFAGLREWFKNNFNKSFLGIFIIANFGLWSIFYILMGKGNYALFGLIILNTAIYDISAYIIGSKFGRNYIVSKISPKKTLEGLIGGVLASALYGLLMNFYFDIKFAVLIFIFGALLAFAGDLLISYFKRQSGDKDTGDILPGHGGILDRIDSHLVATPILIIIMLTI